MEILQDKANPVLWGTQSVCSKCKAVLGITMEDVKKHIYTQHTDIVDQWWIDHISFYYNCVRCDEKNSINVPDYVSEVMEVSSRSSGW